MRDNVVVLTAGLAGSSVVTGLIAQAGYWTGEESFKKEDYNTYENKQLILLNIQLFKEIDYEGRYEKAFDARAISSIESLAGRVDPEPYRKFVETCNRHSPWIWKDPRLWVTLRAWGHWLDLSSVRFVIVTREPLQSWISSIVRRQIQSFGYLKKYTRDIEESVERYLRERGVGWLRIVYEDLLLKPERTIERINKHLDIDLAIDDLKRVFSGEIYKRQRGAWDLVRALLIYSKNYGERLR